MKVTLGDGRVVECENGLTKLAPGPVPEALASEVTSPSRHHGRVYRSDGSTRDPNELQTGMTFPTMGGESSGGGSQYAPIPVMFRPLPEEAPKNDRRTERADGRGRGKRVAARTTGRRRA